MIDSSERQYQEALRREFIYEVARICRLYDDGDEDLEGAFLEIYDLMYGYGYLE